MTAPSARGRRMALAAVLALTAWLGGRGLTDPASVMLSADMSRYMMNGVFVHDLIRDGGVWSVEGLRDYAERYFARYPALTLGHHPPVPYLAVVPFYALFGVSVFAARLTALCWFLLAAWGMFDVGRRLFDWQSGAWAAALFVTNVMALRAGQHLLSEMPTTALVLGALAALLAWRDSRRRVHLALFAILAIASLFAKQLAILALPVYAIVAGTTFGWRGLATRRALLTATVGTAAAASLVALTSRFAPANVALIREGLATLVNGTRQQSLTDLVVLILRTHLSWPALVAVGVSFVVGLWHYRRRGVLLAAWIGAVLGGTAGLLGAVEPARYAFGALPAYYLLAAAPVAASHRRWWRTPLLAGLAALLGWQVWMVRSVHPSGAGGYEEAAEYVVANAREPVVLYHGVVDTGYFVFFTRAHDPAARLVVLRAEKLLATPPAGDATADGDIEALLQRQGVQFVVVEDREAETPVLARLHAMLKSDRFIERRRIPIASRHPGMAGASLLVYEYGGARPADADAVVDIGVWRAGRRITVPIRDLVRHPAQ